MAVPPAAVPGMHIPRMSCPGHGPDRVRAGHAATERHACPNSGEFVSSCRRVAAASAGLAGVTRLAAPAGRVCSLRPRPARSAAHVEALVDQLVDCRGEFMALFDSCSLQLTDGSAIEDDACYQAQHYKSEVEYQPGDATLGDKLLMPDGIELSDR